MISRQSGRLQPALMGLVLLGGALIAPQVHAAGAIPAPPRQQWSFAGIFGRYDNAELQRGFKVYREVCAACHGLSKLSFRNLAEPGGPEFSPEQVRALAAEYTVKAGPNEQGEMFERPGRPADRFPSNFPNKQAAMAAMGGAYAPDFSVLAKARTYSPGFPWFILDGITGYQEHGPDYLYALIALGYVDPPAGKEIEPGLNYNKYFPGNKIAMVAPLADGQVEYTDGTPNTVSQMTRDVVAFMTWAAEPRLEERKRMGFRVMLFLIVFAVLLYYTKKKVWADVKGGTPGGAPQAAH